MEPINFFESPEFLEPRCPKCSSKVDYGVTTRWSEKDDAHICIKCGAVLR